MLRIQLIKTSIFVLATTIFCFSLRGQDGGLNQAAKEVQIGIELMTNLQLEEAENHFNRAIQSNPVSAEAYYWMAKLKVEQEDYQKAIEMGTKAIWMDKTLYEAHFQLFVAYSKLQLRQEAKYHIIETARINPEFVSRKGASMIIEYEDLGSALYFFKAAYTANSSNVLNALNFGRALLINKDPKNAELVLRSAFVPSNTEEEQFNKLYEMYYNTLLENKRFQEVLDCPFLTAHDPDSNHQYYFKAMSYFHLGDVGKFKENANQYFHLKDQTAPQSLLSWAMAESGVRG